MMTRASSFSIVKTFLSCVIFCCDKGKAHNRLVQHPRKMSLLHVCCTTVRGFVKKGLFLESTYTACHRTAGYASGGVAKDKEPLKKAKTPQGRFDMDETESKSKVVFERFPDDVNPETKEKGGPRGPDPTRYGDWERKGRCIDF
ncbi:succinate dehydrogenase assembly factor 4, mitochondrial-like [Sinocyclocheilus anshuiensis]|uniref:Succinate dehydrogenase assembly factor 4, mitochondrial n=1 Tax=Sinocyclocheilus anshuiensis TaxID=1608454 RepID=A0A671P373_9TELE|nr:PREDICTED: succinate dehydrogenase assembly factor 4, mitochondrial-like [Sinocyclocheilus anshuiensis]